MADFPGDNLDANRYTFLSRAGARRQESGDLHSSMTDRQDKPKDIAEDSGGYRVLARKYRPQSFAGLIGQGPMVQTLSHAFASGRIAQAYMLTGVRGVGKTTTARILARALNYQTEAKDGPDIGLAEMGQHCAEIMAGHHVDVMEMDAASHTGIDDIRDIIASTQYRPISARYKVYIIDEVHMLSKSAFNGLLKTLEEPPQHVKFIFATTEIRKVPVTVLSRCQRFDLRRIETAEMVAHLEKIAALEEITVAKDASAMIARASEGSVRDALSLLDQAIAYADGEVPGDDVRKMLGLADRTRVIDLFEHVMKGDTPAALGELKSQYDSGADPATVLADLADFVHYVTRVRFVPAAADDRSLPEQERLRGKEFAEKLSPRVLGRAWQMLLKGIVEVQNCERPLAAADMVLVRLTHAADLPTPDEALRQLGETSPSKMAGPASPAGGSSAAGHSHPTGGAALPRQAISPMPAAPAAPKAELVAAVQINTFDDLLAIAEQKRDIAFKLALRNHVRLVSFAKGRIEIGLSGNCPASFINDISAKLQAWTGERWMVVASKSEGEATRKEQEEALREMQVADAENSPAVAAIMAKFPGAKIVDVRVREDEPPLVDPSLEDDDNGGLDDYFNGN